MQNEQIEATVRHRHRRRKGREVWVLAQVKRDDFASHLGRLRNPMDRVGLDVLGRYSIVVARNEILHQAKPDAPTT